MRTRPGRPRPRSRVGGGSPAWAGTLAPEPRRRRVDAAARAARLRPAGKQWLRRGRQRALDLDPAHTVTVVGLPGDCAGRQRLAMAWQAAAAGAPARRRARGLAAGDAGAGAAAPWRFRQPPVPAPAAAGPRPGARCAGESGPHHSASVLADVCVSSPRARPGGRGREGGARACGPRGRDGDGCAVGGKLTPQPAGQRSRCPLARDTAS